MRIPGLKRGLLIAEGRVRYSISREKQRDLLTRIIWSLRVSWPFQTEPDPE